MLFCVISVNTTADSSKEKETISPKKTAPDLKDKSEKTDKEKT